MTEKEKYRQLVQRYRDDKASEEELEVLFHLLAQGKLDDVLEEVMNGEELAARKTQAPVITLFKRAWFRIAACVLILLAVSVWLFVNNKTSQQAAHTTASTEGDIRPGRQGAVLTLSNGQKIVLDSAGNGMLTTDAQVHVIKKGDKIIYEGKGGETLYNTISTEKGRQWQLTLSDGTKVWLNAASSIRYPLSFSGNQREVEITGELYFEVTHNAQKPFRVKVNDGSVVEVLGTSFNINSYSDEPYTGTTLLQGKIKLVKGGKEKILNPGQQILAKSSGEMEISRPDLEEVVAWKNGRFFYTDASMEVIMRHIARWYDVNVSFRDKIADTYTVDLSREVALSKLLQFLEISGGVHFEINGREITVTKK